MSDEDDNNNNNNNSSGASTQRADPFGDVGNNINNEAVDNNKNNNDDDHDDNPTTVSENNDISVDEEAGSSNVNSSEQNTGTRPEVIDDDECPVPAQDEDPDVTMRKVKGNKPEIINDDDYDDEPLPPSQISALYEQMDDGDEGGDKKKHLKRKPDLVHDNDRIKEGESTVRAPFIVSDIPSWRFLSKAKKTEGYSSMAAGVVVEGISANELVEANFTVTTLR